MLLSLFTRSLIFKERQERFPLVSLQKSDSEQTERFAQVAQEKRVMGAISSFSQAIRSFAHKKQAICLKKL